MSDNWNVIKDEVHAFRNYVHKLPPGAAKEACYCNLLKKDEIDRLLTLKDGAGLDGLRIYFGAKMIDGHLVPTIHVVAVEKDGDGFNDFGVPGALPDVALAVETGVKPLAFSATAPSTDTSKGTTTGGTYPCPTFCSGSTNILNS